MLGDSFTYGYRLTYDQTLPKQLEGVLNDKFQNSYWEVIGITRGSLSFLDYLSLYESFGSLLEADLVIIVLCRNDCNFADDPLPENIVDWDERSLRFFEQYLSDLCKIIREKGAEPLLLYYHTITGEPPWFGQDDLTDILSDVCGKLDCNFLDTGRFFKNYSYKVIWVAENDWHPSGFAHRIMAVELARLIEIGHVFKQKTTFFDPFKLFQNLSSLAGQPGIDTHWLLSKFRELAIVFGKRNCGVKIDKVVLVKLGKYLLASQTLAALTVAVNGLHAERCHESVDNLHRLGKEVALLQTSLTLADESYLLKFEDIDISCLCNDSVNHLAEIYAEISKILKKIDCVELPHDVKELLAEFGLDFGDISGRDYETVNQFVGISRVLLTGACHQLDKLICLEEKCQTDLARKSFCAIAGYFMAYISCFLQVFLKDSSLLSFFKNDGFGAFLPEQDLYHNWQGLHLFGTIDEDNWQNAVRKALPVPLWGHWNQNFHFFDCEGRERGDIHVVAESLTSLPDTYVVVQIESDRLKKQFICLVELLQGNIECKDIGELQWNPALMIVDGLTIVKNRVTFEGISPKIVILSNRLEKLYFFADNFNDFLAGTLDFSPLDFSGMPVSISSDEKHVSVLTNLTSGGGARKIALMGEDEILLEAYLQLVSSSVGCDFFIGEKTGTFLGKKMLTVQEAGRLQNRPYILLPEGPQQISGIASIQKRKLMDNGFLECDFTKLAYFLERIHRFSERGGRSIQSVLCHPVTWLHHNLDKSFYLQNASTQGWTLTMIRGEEQ
jgi:hypothetical protein